MIGDQSHTLQLTSKSVMIGGKPMLISTSIDITERKRFEEELTFHAFHDQLTGLPNRALMRELVDAALLAHADDELFALRSSQLDSDIDVNLR